MNPLPYSNCLNLNRGEVILKGSSLSCLRFDSQEERFFTDVWQTRRASPLLQKHGWASSDSILLFLRRRYYEPQSLTPWAASWQRLPWALVCLAADCFLQSTVTSPDKGGAQSVLAGLSVMHCIAHTEKTKHYHSVPRAACCINAAEMPMLDKYGGMDWKNKITKRRGLFEIQGRVGGWLESQIATIVNLSLIQT